MRYRWSSFACSALTVLAGLTQSTAVASPLEKRDIGVVAGLAPLEPSNGILFGAWVNELSGTDTPNLVNQRFDHKPLSLFQSNINIPDDLNLIPKILQLVDDTQTDAVLYLTVYPMTGFSRVTDSSIDQLAQMIQTAVAKGRRVMIRYAPEMNGSWFPYGQQPIAFISEWKRFYTRFRQGISDKSKIAFLWAPNSSNGYPFLGGAYSHVANASASDRAVLDTNKDGAFDFWDDPYSPYYPGDDFVDWVGLSLYHYGKEYPWVDNVVPNPGVVEAMIGGKPNMSSYDFYNMFSNDGKGPNVTNPVSKGGKPFMVAETAATFHLGFLKPGQPETATTALNKGPGMLAIKQAWWRQIFNQTFLDTHPKVKGVCLFEFKKQEEETLREFRTMGDYLAGNGKDDTEENQVAKVFRQELIAMGNSIRWASKTSGAVGGGAYLHPGLLGIASALIGVMVAVL
ncbi:uncharacterized protein SPPG_04435 [Spizellomyces punctatus DAOM BR117]|uniref:GH26 domain-containing protein n=1 Tax=Spizellomyces punctatus (strain DAOM BR117) TaxID=645134 RepID=A0A0L0HH37_SPIPD|nr:uncharacterized protein SPPG_04435 [Spizellomyces punctatus DAOM BR117]KND00094.1 hypothetical protein SPPG_04435 [Spizellomyces punctatus DAOM BR117]|eukprot:XP_016608133.1 hypothetical protein SPPG_04435 [Spizellomyces punctatus DAOM BR117]